VLAHLSSISISYIICWDLLTMDHGFQVYFMTIQKSGDPSLRCLKVWIVRYDQFHCLLPQFFMWHSLLHGHPLQDPILKSYINWLVISIQNTVCRYYVYVKSNQLLRTSLYRPSSRKWLNGGKIRFYESKGWWY